MDSRDGGGGHHGTVWVWTVWTLGMGGGAPWDRVSVDSVDCRGGGHHGTMWVWTVWTVGMEGHHGTVWMWTVWTLGMGGGGTMGPCECGQCGL